MLKSKVAIWFIGLSGLVFGARGQYANDWIDYNQQYYKIKVAEDGLYRIIASELAAAGVPVGGLAYDRYQMYRQGEEIAVRRVKNTDDNRLNYLEFYGERNDGESDTPLYKEVEAQPHTFYNLFTDSSAYFLTWEIPASTGQQMQSSTDQNSSGLTAQPYHIQEDLQLSTSSYKAGLRYGTTREILTAEYDYGEGWAGPDISKNGSRTYNFTLPNSDQSELQPTLEVFLFGINNLEHLVEVSAGPDGSSLRSLGQASFERQFTNLFSAPFEWTDIGAGGELVVRVTALGVDGQAERVAVSYVRVLYPQDPSFDSSQDAFFYEFPGGVEEKGYAIISSTVASGARVFDITNTLSPVSIVSSASAGQLEFVFPNATTDRKIMVVKATKSVGSISAVDMNEPDLAGKDFLMMSHPALDAEVDGINPVTDYVNYRQNASGGNHEVLLTYIDDIYDQFNYGDPSPVAIRNFISYALSVGSPEYLFLIGKGTTPNANAYRREPGSIIHYVPTFGYPGSDVLFTTQVASENLEQALPTGRLNAYTPEDVKAYLDKVKDMEALSYDQLWRKNLVQLSGGATSAERTSFANHINTFKVKAESDYLGGKAFNINKQTNDEVQLINIASQVNEGVSLITFFGHSTGQLTDIEIGRVSAGNNTFGYNNPAKYPMFLVNGCNAGEIFTISDGTPDNLTLGEDWLHTPNVGAIGFIANSDFALSSGLKRFSDLFYTHAFNLDAEFANAVGVTFKNVCEAYFNAYGTSTLDRAQVYQTVLQGDPTIPVFGADRPDYELRTQEIFASGFDQERVIANMDSFRINLPIWNYGRSVQDSLSVRVVRTLGDGTQKTYHQNFRRILRQDTLPFVIVNDLQEVNEGTNTFLISVDPNNEQPELNETNNNGSFELFIPKGNTINLFPIDFGIVSDPTVTFKWQSADPLDRNREYSFEVDTTAGFSSPFKSSRLITEDLLVTLEMDFSMLVDSATIYWRTRFSTPKGNEDTTWVNSSFTLISGTESGWGQIGRSQLGETTRAGVTYDSGSKKWDFRETATPIEINTHGVSNPNEYTDYLVLIDGINFLATTNTLDPECKKKNAINAIVFGAENAQPYSPFLDSSPDVFNDLICGIRPQMINNFSESEVLGPNRYLDSLISIMDSRDMILLFSFDSVAFSNWDAQLISSLNEVGIQSTTIAGLTDGQPVIFLGRKGDPEGSALEVISNGSGVPVKEQAIQLVSQVTGKFSSGTVLSPQIGPSKSWKGFTYNIEEEASDVYNFNVLGYDSFGEEEILFSDSRIVELDVSQIDAQQYPFLRMELTFSDEVNQTPPQLRGWSLTYDKSPEGLLSTETVEDNEVQEGQEYTREFYFSSLTDTEYSDSLTVRYTVSNVGSGTFESDDFKIAAPDPNDTTTFDTRIDTKGRVGQNNLVVTLSANEPELYPANNTINISSAFNVVPDETNPVLDVTFDGSYILNGDIVSPDPNILVRFKDENEYLYKQDTTGLTIEMKGPCDECEFERVAFSGSNVSYIPAAEDQDFEINYLPGPLEDGVYSLRVQGVDESGNASGRYPYEVAFEVINESTVTHFYPYPNPFSTQTRFVFTLTGSVIPEEIKIQIMTVSGRVVREITRDEIGPIKIGNNITQYAWDGRDEYGDQLANGVYLYRVFIRQEGEQVKLRNTNADRAFKNGFGKLYLLR